MILDSPIISGSSTVTGNLTVLGTLTANVSGSTTSASYATNAETLDGLDSTSFTTTSSFNTASGSFSTRVTDLETASGSFSTRVTNNESTGSSLTTASGSFSTRVTNTEATASNLVTASGSFSTRTTNLETASGSFSTRTTNLETASGSFSTRVTSAESSITSLNGVSGSYATTGSNNFNGNQVITGSLTTTGTIVAQTLNVQQVTSSIVYSSGSNIFGNNVSNTQQFTGSLQVSGSTHYLLGNVGIGTSSPDAKLQVVGSFGQQIRFGTNTSVYTNISMGSGFTTFDSIGGDSGAYSFRDDGTTRMFIDSSGNVGIGTTSPYQNLQVYQTGTAGNNYVEGTIQVGGTSTTLGAALSYAAQNSGYVNLVNLNTSGGANARISFGFGAISSGLPASTVMTLNQSGNVGIGTASPLTLLQVGSTSVSSGGGQLRVYGFDGSADFYNLREEGPYNATIQLHNNPLNGNPGAPGISFRARSSSTDSRVQAVIYSAWTTTTDASRTSKLVFQTTDSGTTSDKVTIIGNGNVGIGTTSPTNKLEVDGGSSAVALRVSTTNPGAGVATLILANSSKSAFNDGVKISHGAGYTNITDLNNTNIMTWDMSNTRVGIGTTSPSYQLDLGGGTTVNTRLRLQRGSDDTNQYGIYGWNQINLYRANVSIGSAQTDFSINQVGSDGSRTPFYISSGGNVGIGTSSPFSSLDVSTSSTGAICVGNSSNTISSGDLIGAISFVSRDGSTYSSGGVTNIRSYATETYNTSTVGADLRFYTTSGVQNIGANILFGSERMRITGGGAVCINTTTSQYSAVLNTYRTPVNSNYIRQIIAQGAGYYPSLMLGIYDQYDGFIATAGNDLRILAGLDVTTEDHNIIFYTSFNGGTTGAQNYERMRISYNGNVGIGTADPQAKLDVNGNILLSETGYLSGRAFPYNTTVGAGADATKTYIDAGSTAGYRARIMLSGGTAADANTIILYTASSERMRINNAGVVTKPYQVAFRVHNSSNITVSTDATIILDSVDYNVGSTYNASTGIFTAPYSGKYLFTFEASAVANGSFQYNAVYLIVAGTPTGIRFRGPGYLTTNAWFGIAGSVILDLSATNTVYLSGYTEASSMLLPTNETNWCGYFLG